MNGVYTFCATKNDIAWHNVSLELTVMRKPVEIEIEFVVTPARWDSVAHSADGNIVILECKLTSAKKRRLDAAEVRDEFLGLGTEHDLAKFLADTGQFVSNESRFADLSKWQSLIRSLLSTELEKWAHVLSATDKAMAQSIVRYRNQMVHFPFDQGKSVPVIRASSTLEAIVASLLVDHLNGIRYGVCARVDCGKVFTLTTGRKRIFCTQYCGHLVSLRKKRKGGHATKATPQPRKASVKPVSQK